ncbi:RNA-binding protein [Hysterangium stoloniferum]|nr:RNA-binding protein [Hysterangium stoloniferum]
MGKDKSEKKEKKKARKSEVDVPELELEDAPVRAEDVDMVDGTSASPVNKKSKKDKEEIVIPLEDLSPIAHPLAQKKLVKKLHKTIKKASKRRQVKRGVKEVVKGIRKGDKGLLILAADISPIDIISHLPVLSEESQIPYIFVASKEELGHASSTKRPTSCVMICPKMRRKPKKTAEGQEVADDKADDYQELYDECVQEVQALDEKILI